MQWIAISGSWRKSNARMERDVREAVAAIMARGDGIVSGGALGVDFVATTEVLRHDPAADRIRIIIPTPLDIFATHYRTRAREGVITARQAETLISLLTDLKHRNPQALQEMHHTALNETTYYDRNTRVLDQADELLAFQVNNSLGTQDTIDKARARGLRVICKSYSIA